MRESVMEELRVNDNPWRAIAVLAGAGLLLGALLGRR